MDWTQTTGYLAGLLTTIAFIPQVVRAYRTRRCDDLSWGMLLIFTTGVVLWLLYGLFLRSAPIILANAVTLVLNLLLLAMKIHYGSGARP
jgi:MtN3 and saliva related transmembrane protein